MTGIGLNINSEYGRQVNLMAINSKGIIIMYYI